MMKVIILNGPMGVGKTAVGKYIADNTLDTTNLSIKNAAEKIING